MILTRAALTGAALVPATDQATATGAPASRVVALACDVTRNGPEVFASVSVVSSWPVPPAPAWLSRAVSRKCSVDAYEDVGRNSE